MSPAEISEAKCSHPHCDNIGHWFNEDGDFWCRECLEGARAEAEAAQASVAGVPPHATSAGQLCEQIESLLALDADGALVPHGIGGLARELLQRSADKIKTLWTLNSVLIQQSENNVRSDTSTSIDNRNMELDGLGGLDCHSSSSVDVVQTVVAGVPETRDDAADQQAADHAVMSLEGMAFQWVVDAKIDKVIDAASTVAGPHASKLASWIHGLVTQGWIEGADAGFVARKKLTQAAHDEIAELNEMFEATWAADRRAVDLWRKANPGNDLVLPDRAKLTGWLLEQITPGSTPPVDPYERAAKAEVVSNKELDAFLKAADLMQPGWAERGLQAAFRIRALKEG